MPTILQLANMDVIIANADIVTPIFSVKFILVYISFTVFIINLIIRYIIVFVNNVCDFIKVIVIPNTTNILAIQPKTKAEENQYNFLNGDLGKLFNRDSNVMYKSDIHERYNK